MLPAVRWRSLCSTMLTTSLQRIAGAIRSLTVLVSIVIPAMLIPGRPWCCRTPMQRQSGVMHHCRLNLQQQDAVLAHQTLTQDSSKRKHKQEKHHGQPGGPGVHTQFKWTRRNSAAAICVAVVRCLLTSLLQMLEVCRKDHSCAYLSNRLV